MENKVIIIVGVLDKKGSTNVSIAKSFMRYNFTVIPVNYRTIIEQKGMQFFINLLLDACVKYKPYMVLFCKTNGIPPELIAECGKYSKTYYHFMDPIPTAEAMKAHELAKQAQYVSCTGGGVSQWFVKQGVEKCYTVFDGLDYDVFKPIQTLSADSLSASEMWESSNTALRIGVGSIKYIVSFIGSKTKDRDKFANSVNAKCFGPGYKKSVVNKEFAEVCAVSKFMLSMNTYSDITMYFSNRLLRYLGCGACVLHYDPTQTLREIFKDKEELFLFKDEEELKSIVDTVSDEEAGKVALNGYNKVMNTLTWDHFAGNVLNITEEKYETCSY